MKPSPGQPSGGRSRWVAGEGVTTCGPPGWAAGLGRRLRFTFPFDHPLAHRRPAEPGFVLPRQCQEPVAAPAGPRAPPVAVPVRPVSPEIIRWPSWEPIAVP